MSAVATRRPAAGRIRAALTPSPRLRWRTGLVLAVAAVLTAGYLFWLRDSSLVAVDEVTVTGAGGRDGDRIRAALEAAGAEMTTLHVDRRALDDAVRQFPAVRALEVQADFPSRLRIHVLAHVPAAVLTAGDARVPVAADGTMLPGLPAGNVPSIEAGAAMPVERVPPGATRAAVAVAGGAPAALRGRLERVTEQPDRGIVVLMEDGPDLVFGDATRVRAKWAAVARVLADEDAAGAEYLDVRIPARPAAGGLPAKTVAPVAPAGDPGVPPVPEAPAPAEGQQATPPVAEAPAPAQAPQVDPAPVPLEPGDQPATPGGGAVPQPQP